MDETRFKQPLFHGKWDPLTFSIQSVWKCRAWNRSTPPCPDVHSPPPLFCPLPRSLLPPYIFLFLSNRQHPVPAHSQLLLPSPNHQIIDPTELMLYCARFPVHMTRSPLAPVHTQNFPAETMSAQSLMAKNIKNVLYIGWKQHGCFCRNLQITYILQYVYYKRQYCWFIYVH